MLRHDVDRQAIAMTGVAAISDSSSPSSRMISCCGCNAAPTDLKIKIMQEADDFPKILTAGIELAAK
jgi:hypothetical protein